MEVLGGLQRSPALGAASELVAKSGCGSGARIKGKGKWKGPEPSDVQCRHASEGAGYAMVTTVCGCSEDRLWT